jgi:hypothetical protein
MISRANVMVVYFSDDISVGASQEILIAKCFKKPVIGLAPPGGKFNRRNHEIFGQNIKHYRHPFVYNTCDVVCDDIENVAKTLLKLSKIKPKGIEIIQKAADRFEKEKLQSDKYLTRLLDID